MLVIKKIYSDVIKSTMRYSGWVPLEKLFRIDSIGVGFHLGNIFVMLHGI